MKKLTFLLLFILIPEHFSQNSNLGFEFDYAQFAYDSSSNYLEIYYQFDESLLTVSETDSGRMIECKLQVVLTNKGSGEKVVDKEWRIPHSIAGQEVVASKSLVGVVGFILPDGTYNCTITGSDAYKSANVKSINETINVSSFLQSSKISVSDIQIASKMVQGSTNSESIFFKNSYEIVPSPSVVFGDASPVVFYYTELYNLQTVSGSNPLYLTTTIFNSRGKAIATKKKELTKSVNSRVEVGSYAINKYPTDTYTLLITVIDSVGNYGVSSTKRFYVYNPDIMPEADEFADVSGSMSSSFGALSEEELDDVFEKSKYIATLSESNQYSKLGSAESKREFLYKFWLVRDRTPDTQRNEYFLDYMNRSEISTQRFSTLLKKGWKTDRGRVLMVYGEPNEIERYPSQIDVRPYEIWHYYEIEGGVFFVFADITGFSEYVLVHSTMRGELTDESWQRRIQVR